MAKSADDALKVFGISSQLIEHDLDAIETEYGIDLNRGHRRTLEADQSYYPQIETRIRAEAAAMATHYEVFYSLETAIREFVNDSLVDAEGPEWWSSSRVPPQ